MAKTSVIRNLYWEQTAAIKMQKELIQFKNAARG